MKIDIRYNKQTNTKQRVRCMYQIPLVIRKKNKMKEKS